jgi:hypothetical protein
MIGLIGVIVMASIAYFLLRKFLAGRSWLFWLILGFIVLVLLARMT